MILTLLLALAYGTPNCSFPWWVWVLACFTSSGPMFRFVEKKTITNVKNVEAKK